MALPSPQWAHTDSRGLAPAIDAAIARAWSVDSTGNVPASVWTGPLAVADFRALVVAAAITFDLASDTQDGMTKDLSQITGLGIWGVGLPPTGQVIIATPRTAGDFAKADASVADAALAIMSAYTAIANRHAKQTGETPTAANIATTGSSAALPTTPLDVAAFPVVAMVAAIVAGAAVIAYLGDKALDIYDRNIARESDTRRLLALSGKTTEILANHAAADASTGKSTPLSSTEQSIVDALKQAVTRYATPEVLPKPPGGDGPLSSIGTLGALAALAVVSLLLLKKG